MEASCTPDRGGQGSFTRSRAPIRNGNDNIKKSALIITAKRSSTSPQLFRSITWILILFCSSSLSFYVGVWTSLQAMSDTNVGKSNNLSNEQLHRRIDTLAKEKVKTQLEDLCKIPNPPLDSSHNLRQKSDGVSGIFSKSISHFARGLVRVGKDDLMQTFDFGVPATPNTEGLDALILYSNKQAMPSNETVAREARFEDPSMLLPFLPAKTAMENCDTMNVVLINNPGNTKQCFALVGGQYQSYHVQRWMRRPDHYGALNSRMPLKLTSRTRNAAGREQSPPPKQIHVKAHQEKFLAYITETENIKSLLKQTLEKMNTKTVVVLTCNYGQSELLMNFACSARARGFNLKNVLVFPTDLETKELAEGFGLVAFYKEKMMASVPKQEAAVYGDSIFTNVMFAKVLCVQLVNELGYDLLFQDADVVWYKDPLGYFHDASLPEFDIYFQDDGSRQERYAPYSANSGFYYVRSNDRTQHLFRNFIYSADLIDAWNSHQQVLIALLSEHSSVMGLSVKIFAKEMTEFPGGLHFHRQKTTMKKIMKGNANAYIFHMSWTYNKDDKVDFFQQMGEWYLKEQCIGKGPNEITDEKSDVMGSKYDGRLPKFCCLPEPLITCHYRDKPSKIPCLESPLIAENGKAFYSAFTSPKGAEFW